MTPEEFHRRLMEGTKDARDSLNHINLLIDTRTAIRTPWLDCYQQSSKGHKATKRLIRRIAKADVMSFPNINYTPFNIEKYIKERTD